MSGLEIGTGIWIYGKTNNIETMNYYEKFVEGIEELHSILMDAEKRDKVAMFRRFILLMDEKHFNNAFEYYFIEETEFDNGWIGFHKSMRQNDFYEIGEGHVDMLFWLFIHTTDIPYKLFKTFTEKIKEGLINEFADDDFETKGWNKFGLFRALRYEKKA